MEKMKHVLKHVVPGLEKIMQPVPSESIDNMVAILENMTENEKKTDGNLTILQIQSIAHRSGFEIKEVQMMLQKYQQSYSLMRAVLKLKSEGKPIPNTINELTTMMREINAAPKTNVTQQNHHPTGRNDPCSCGSGKKYKLCCGA
jgi:uncharacterized protein YecA (UPF0149 family)